MSLSVVMERRVKKFSIIVQEDYKGTLNKKKIRLITFRCLRCRISVLSFFMLDSHYTEHASFLKFIFRAETGMISPWQNPGLELLAETVTF